MPLLTSNEDIDLEYANLTNEYNITKARKRGDDLVKGLNESQFNQLRARCKSDLFFLANTVLGYNKLSINLHGNLSAWMMRNRRARFRELLLPRGHYKTTLWTISDSVRLALPDVAGENIWPESLGSDIRILLCHEAAGKAEAFLVAIAGHFLSNPLLMALFPELIPSPRKQRINRSELELPRSSIWPEATYNTMGTGGKNQGLHWNKLKLDDLIGEEARDSKAVMTKAKQWIDNIQSFFSSFNEDQLDLAGTRWAFDDLYEHMHKTYGKELLKYIRGAEEVVDGKLVPIFPEEFSIEGFNIIKQNKKIWTAQYANDPALGSTEFQASWLRWYKYSEPRELEVKQLDGQYKYINTQDMDICILVDPAMSTGLTGMAVTGMDEKGDVAILERFKDAYSPPDFADILFNLVDKWHPRVVAIEEVLFSGLYKYWFEDRMARLGKRFLIEPIKIGTVEKEARVRGLANYFQAGQIIFNEDHQDLITEYNQFGATEDYHILDALSMGPRVWRKGIRRDRLYEQDQAELILSKSRDPVYGYSKLRSDKHESKRDQASIPIYERKAPGS